MTKDIVFLIYCILFETLVLGGCGYVVFVMGYSGWWFVLAIAISTCQMKRHNFFNEERKYADND